MQGSFRILRALVKGMSALALALLLLLLPALFIQPPPKRPLRVSAQRDVGLVSSLTGIKTRTNVGSRELSKDRKDAAISLPEPVWAYDAPLSPELALVDASSVGLRSEEGPLLSEDDSGRAQFSWGRVALSGADTVAARQFMGGISVRGAILFGGAVARDRLGRPVATLQQPNLLTAGRGFISTSAKPSRQLGVAPTTQSSGSEQLAVTPTPKQADDTTFTRTQSGIFDFEESASGKGRVFRTRRGVREQIAAFDRGERGNERFEIIGTQAAQTWNEFVGEIFLMVVAPTLLGEMKSDGFRLKELDADSHLQLLKINQGDLLLMVNGIGIAELSIEDLPDLLLGRTMVLQMIRTGTYTEVALDRYITP